MNYCSFFVPSLLFLQCVLASIIVNSHNLNKLTDFFSSAYVYTINQRKCNCQPLALSCTCCESVFIWYSKLSRKLCLNFRYNINVLMVEIKFDASTLRSQVLSNNEHIRVCTSIPGCLFSSICLKILEVNFFSRSITVCPQMNLSSKSRKWQISYTCISINTVNTTLPSSSVMSGMTTLRSLIPSGGASVGQIGQLRPAGLAMAGMFAFTTRPVIQTTRTLTGQMGLARPPGMMIPFVLPSSLSSSSGNTAVMLGTSTTFTSSPLLQTTTRL